MKTKKCGYLIVRGLLMGALLFAVSGMTSPACANDAEDSSQLVEKSRMTLEKFVNAREMEAFRSLLKKARGVFIAPQILKGAFVVGASGGSGVFVVRDRKTATWAGPAFYTIGEASFGFQAGGEASEVILLAMTDRGITALLGIAPNSEQMLVLLSGRSVWEQQLQQKTSVPTLSVLPAQKGYLAGLLWMGLW